MEQQDLLQEVEQEIYFEKASTGARFANYLIDLVGFYILIFIGLIVYAMMTIPERIQADEAYSYGQSKHISKAMLYLCIYVAYLLYYLILEGITKGRTLGKLITGTRAIQQDGTSITWKNAFIRSLCRIVPFEPFSAFGNPWHDTWSETQIIKVKK